MIEWQDFPRSRPGHRITRAELSAPAPYTHTVGIDWYCHSDGCRLYPASPLDSVLRGIDILTAWRNDHRYAGYGVSVADHTALVIRLAERYAADNGWSQELTDLFIRGVAIHEGGEAIVKDQITMTKRALPQLAAMDDVWTAAIAEGAGVDWLMRFAEGRSLPGDEPLVRGLRHVDLLALSTEMTVAHHDGRWDIPDDIWIDPTDWSIEMAREVATTGRWLHAHPEAHGDMIAAYIWRNIWRGQPPQRIDFCFMTALRKKGNSMTDRKLLPPRPLSPTEQANLDRMGDHVWIHVGHGKWTAADTAAGADVLTSRQIAVLWRGGWIEKADHVGARRTMKRSNPPGIPEGVLRC